MDTEFALELKDVLEMESLKEEKVFLLFFDELIYSGISDDNQLGIALLEDGNFRTYCFEIRYLMGKNLDRIFSDLKEKAKMILF